MKQVVLFALMVCTGIGDCFAQENRYYTTDGKMTNYWGVRINWDIECASYGRFCNHTYLPFDLGPGVSVGGGYHWSFGKRFFVEPGGELYYNTNAITSDLYNEYLKETGTLSTMGVRVLVKLGIAFGAPRGCILVYTGASESFSFYGREKAEFKNPQIPNIDRSAFNIIRRFETHVCFGISFVYRNISYNSNFSFGASNNLRLKDYSIYRSIIQFGVGYNF